MFCFLDQTVRQLGQSQDLRVRHGLGGHGPKTASGNNEELGNRFLLDTFSVLNSEKCSGPLHPSPEGRSSLVLAVGTQAKRLTQTLGAV